MYLMNEVPGYDEILNDPSRVWNCDESGFPLTVEKSKVLAQKGSKYVFKLTAEGHTQITVLACLSASGLYVQPFIIFKGERARSCNMHDFPEAFYSSTKTGWMDGETFLSFVQVFAKHLRVNNITLPVLLYLDGHSSHLSYDVAKYCKENGIILYCLPPHSSHAMQPLDVGFFGPLKNKWHKELQEWHFQNPGIPFVKGCFPGLFRKVWEESSDTEKAKHGFLRAGIFPLNPQNVNMARLVLQTKTEETPVEESAGDIPFDTPVVVAITHIPRKALNEVNDGDADNVPHVSHSFHDVENSDSSILDENLSHMSPISREHPYVDDTSILDDSVCGLVSKSSTWTMAQELPGIDLDLPTVIIHAAPLPLDETTKNPSATVTNHLVPTTLFYDDETIGIAEDDDDIDDKTPSQATDVGSYGIEPFLPTATSTVSKAFELLQLPVVKRRPGKKSLFPKATTGNEAIKLLQERELKKKEEEVGKIRRKLEREKKKKEKEEEKIAKKLRKEEKCLKKKRASKVAKKKGKTCIMKESSSSSSDDSMDIIYMNEPPEDDSFMNVDKDSCYICSGKEGDTDDWVGCDECPRFAHKLCTKDEYIINLSDEEDLHKYPYLCEKCDYT